MEQILEWLSTWDFSAVMTVLISYVSANIVALITLVIGIIKSRLANANVSNAISALGLELKQEQIKMIEELRDEVLGNLTKFQEELLTQNADAIKAKQDYIKSIVDDAKKANDEIDNFMSVNTKSTEEAVKNVDINAYLESI